MDIDYLNIHFVIQIQFRFIGVPISSSSGKEREYTIRFQLDLGILCVRQLYCDIHLVNPLSPPDFRVPTTETLPLVKK